MKKIIAICMAALLLLAALPVSLVLADGTVKIVGTVDKANACAGDTIVLTVSMENNPGLAGWLIDVEWDTSALELTAQAGGTAFAGVGSLSFNKVENQSPSNALWYEFISGNNYTDNGVLFTMTFKVKEGAANGDYNIRLYCSDMDNMCNIEFEQVPADFVSPTVKIGHSYDNDCDATCNSCGAVREVAAHPYEGAVTKNEDCGNAGEKTYTCPICGDSYKEPIPATGNHTYDNACDASCNVCGQNRTAEAHKYDNACDKDCNVCGAIREVADHVYTDACDVDCNECGATRTAPHSYTYACDKVCALCGELTNPEADHNIVHMEAVEPGCHYTGNVEYWFCSYCGAAWTNEELTEVTNLKSVVIPALGGDVIHVPAVEATEDKEGNIEYWFCEKCEQFWTDEALTQLTNSKNVVTPKKEAEIKDDTTTTTKPGDETGKQPGDKLGENVVVIVLAGMIALIAAAAVVLFSKKKKA